MNNKELRPLEPSDNTKSPKFLLTDDTFNRLRHAQETIQQETGFTPTFKKLINDIVNETAINELTNRYIEKMKS